MQDARERASLLDRCVRPTLGARGVSSYVAAGVVGYLGGLVLVLVLGTHAGLRPPGLLALALCPPLSLLLSIAVARRLFARARIIFYHKALIALFATMFGFALLGEDVWLGADLATLGIGTFLAFGRLGCFCVACCHGQRARFGVRYGWQHAASGYPERWVGLPMFPLQLVDAAASAFAVALGTLVQWAPHRPGAPLAAYAVTYGLLRFGLEFARGDAERHYLAGLSEAQWTAVLTVVLAATIAPSAWSVLTAFCLVLGSAALAIAYRKQRWRRLWLLSGPHLAELDAALAALHADGPSATTSQGLRLALVLRPPERFELVLSHVRGKLSTAVATTLAHQLGRNWTVLGISAGSSEHRFTLKHEVPAEAIVT